MTKVISIKLIDVISFSKGLVFVRKEALQNESFKVSFFNYDIDTQKIAPVTKSVYLLNKFGSSFSPIAQQLGDYVSCAAGKLPDGNAIVIYPTGEMGVFDPSGELFWTGDLFYRDAPARDVAIENKHIWCTVPDHNCIIRYSTVVNKIVMRIGGDDSGTFGNPVAISAFDNKLFICNQGSRLINTVDLENFSVKTYRRFDEPVH
ncbi:MAG: hypothetical protein LBS36_10295, partial [Oscillospiraceae bacterium]|nr:hypothetical protein [Oscillospiraceae bacterium]